jgi:hypothetical protein
MFKGLAYSSGNLEDSDVRRKLPEFDSGTLLLPAVNDGRVTVTDLDVME